MSGTANPKKECCGEKFWQIYQGRPRSDSKRMNPDGEKKKGVPTYYPLLLNISPKPGFQHPSRPSSEKKRRNDEN